MAPAAAMAWSVEIMSESFLLSNISPQDPDFNRGIWRDLEAMVRDWAVLHGEVFVITGPVLSEQLPSIGPNEVSVPESYYKVVVDLTPPEVEGIGFILPNGSANQSIDRYAVTIDSVETVTGFDFFPVVVDSLEEEIERTISEEHWGFEVREVPTLTGDFDSSGKVDFNDFFVFADGFGGSDPHLDLCRSTRPNNKNCSHAHNDA